MMGRVRSIHGGTEKHTQIITADKMNRKCHAYHRYEIYLPSKAIDGQVNPVAVINFQNGAIKEVGVNGCSNEDLLAIVLDRLECLQAGEFPCKENKRAIECIKTGLLYLNDRTKDREARGVEGMHKS